MTKKIITVEGMHCMHCAGSVEKAVSSLEGIKSAKVNLEKKICTAKLASDITDDKIREVISEAGFEVTGIETKTGLF